MLFLGHVAQSGAVCRQVACFFSTKKTGIGVSKTVLWPFQAIKNQELYLKIAEREKSTIEEQRAHVTLGRTYLIQAETFQGEKFGKVHWTLLHHNFHHKFL